MLCAETNRIKHELNERDWMRTGHVGLKANGLDERLRERKRERIRPFYLLGPLVVSHQISGSAGDELKGNAAVVSK